MKNLSIRKFALTTRMSSRKLIKQLSALSLNSTQTVDAVHTKSWNSDENNNNAPKKKVQFNELDNEWHYAEDENGDDVQLTTEEMEQCWYNGAEIQTFREDAMRVASKWAKQAETNAPTTMARTLTRAYEATSSNQTTRLLKDLHLPINMIGLEGWVMRKKCVDDRKDAVIEAVLGMQDATFSDESVRAEKMRAAARAHTKYSACFAAQIAIKAWRDEQQQR